MAPDITMLAPFERGLASGGSFRSTTIAERLETRGASVTWEVAAKHRLGRPRQAIAAFAGPPLGVLEWATAEPRAGTTMACHSFMAGDLRRWDRAIVDFHNIEYDVVADLAQLRRGVRRWYWQQHARRLEGFEQDVARASDAVLVATDRDRRWIRERAGREALLVPNLLPAAEAASSRSVQQMRTAASVDPDRILFIGTLQFASNELSLDRFLAGPWRSIRARLPGLQLDIIGRCSPAAEERWTTVPGARVHGFVEDIDPFLRTCSAAVLPLEMSAGSSLRVLKLGLAGIPLFGTPGAFRGFEGMGRVASTPDEWAQELEQLMRHPDVAAELVTTTFGAVDRLHRDQGPWDELWSIATS